MTTDFTYKGDLSEPYPVINPIFRDKKLEGWTQEEIRARFFPEKISAPEETSARSSFTAAMRDAALKHGIGLIPGASQLETGKVLLKAYDVAERYGMQPAGAILGSVRIPGLPWGGDEAFLPEQLPFKEGWRESYEEKTPTWQRMVTETAPLVLAPPAAAMRASLAAKSAATPLLGKLPIEAARAGLIPFAAEEAVVGFALAKAWHSGSMPFRYAWRKLKETVTDLPGMPKDKDKNVFYFLTKGKDGQDALNEIPDTLDKREFYTESALQGEGEIINFPFTQRDILAAKSRWNRTWQEQMSETMGRRQASREETSNFQGRGLTEIEGEINEHAFEIDMFDEVLADHPLRSSIKRLRNPIATEQLAIVRPDGSLGESVMVITLPEAIDILSLQKGGKTIAARLDILGKAGLTESNGNIVRVMRSGKKLLAVRIDATLAERFASMLQETPGGSRVIPEKYLESGEQLGSNIVNPEAVINDINYLKTGRYGLQGKLRMLELELLNHPDYGRVVEADIPPVIDRTETIVEDVLPVERLGHRWTPAEIDAAREWLRARGTNPVKLSDHQVVYDISTHYPGGWDQFFTDIAQVEDVLPVERLITEEVPPTPATVSEAQLGEQISEDVSIQLGMEGMAPNQRVMRRREGGEQISLDDLKTERAYEQLIRGDVPEGRELAPEEVLWNPEEPPLKDLPPGGAGPSPMLDPDDYARRQAKPLNMAGLDSNPGNTNLPPPGSGEMLGVGDPSSAGNRYVFDLLELPTDLIRTIDPESDNRVSRFFMYAAAKLGVNPNLAKNNPIARIMAAAEMQQVAIDNLISVSMARVFGPAVQRFTGRLDLPINSRTGAWAKGEKRWFEVWEHPAEMAGRPVREQELVQRYLEAIGPEIERIRLLHGLPRRTRLREEGHYYVPRKVVEIHRGGTRLVPDKHSTGHLARIFEDSLEATKEHGVIYEVDPMATFELHLRQAYKEILNEQVRAATEPYWITAASTVPESVKQAHRVARLQVRAARVALQKATEAAKGEELTTRIGRRLGKEIYDLAPAVRRAQQQLRKERQPIREGLERDVIQADKNLKLAKANGKAASLEYRGYIEKAKKANWMRGSLFGKAEAIVPVKQANLIRKIDQKWAQVLYVGEDAKALEEAYNSVYKPSSKVASGFMVVANTVRATSSVFDAALPFIHGQTSFGSHPKVWAKMAYRHWISIGDPTVQMRLMDDNWQDYKELAQNWVGVGDPEMFAALAPGQHVPVGKILQNLGPPGSYINEVSLGIRDILRFGGKQTFGRFQAAYNAGLGWNRVLLLRALRDNWDGGPNNDVYSHIRNMTGGLESRGLGVGPGQRAAESFWGAFSPRLLRSVSALMWDAMHPTTQKGREALKSIALLMSATASLYILSGLALGKTKEQILEGLQPNSGRKFLSHQMHGHWIGPGGTIRGLVQFTGAMYSIISGDKHIKGLISTNQFDNPFILMYTSKAAPGTRLIQAISEGFLGGNPNFLPFDDIEDFPDTIATVAKWGVPFWGQSLIESRRLTGTVAAKLLREIRGTEEDDLKAGSIQVAAMETMGPRASFSEYDQATMSLFEGKHSVYTDLPPFLRHLTRETVNIGKSRFNDIEKNRRTRLKAMVSEEFNYKNWQDIEQFYKGQRSLISEDLDFPPNDVTSDDLGVRALSEYYEMINSIAKRFKGKPKLASEEIERQLEALEDLWTEDQKIYVVANTNMRPIPGQIALQFRGIDEMVRIVNSQSMREQMLLAAGYPDLAMLSHRIFFMLDSDQQLWDPTEVVHVTTPPAMPEPGPSALEELVGWGKEVVGALGR